MRKGLLLSFASGCLLALAHPPYGAGWLAFACLVPFLLAAESRIGRPAGWRESALSGYVLGLGQFGVLLYWIAFLPPDEMVYPVLRYPATIVLVLGLSFHSLFFSLLLHWMRRGAGVPLWLAAPLAWSGVEWLRGSTSMGFPWGSLGYALAEYPPATQIASWLGVLGVSAWVVLTNVLVTGLVSSLRRREISPLRQGVSFLLVLWAPLVWGAMTLRAAPAPAEEVRVALIQPNVAGSIKWQTGFKDWNLALLEDMTLVAAATEAELIIWPETAATSYLRFDAPYRRRAERAVTRGGSPVIGGFLDAEPLGDGGWSTYNAAGLMLPGEGLTTIYRKLHLVPFGEEMPFADLIPALDRLDLGEADFSPGEEGVLLRWRSVRAGMLICFESIFPGLARDAVRRGSNLLVNITNDSWFGDSPAPHQHASMAVLRAVELRRSLARSANTGVSMLVDPWGRVTAQSSVFRREILVGSLPLLEEETIFARWGHLIEPAYGTAAILLGLAATALRRRRKPGTP